MNQLTSKPGFAAQSQATAPDGVAMERRRGQVGQQQSFAWQQQQADDGGLQQMRNAQARCQQQQL